MADLTLHTPRLRLRQWQPSDLDPFAAMSGDPEVMRLFPRLRSRAECSGFMARNQDNFDARGFGLWAMDLPGTGFIGYCGLSVRGFEASFMPCVEIGWGMAQAHWGQGYATEAACAALADGFGRAGLREVVSFTAACNTRSRRVMERIGMVRDRDGDFAHPAIPADHPVSLHVLYRIKAPRMG